MSLKIDEQSADALTFRIAEGFKKVNAIFFGLHISDFAWAAEVQKMLPEPIDSKISKICGEGGLADFLFGQVTLKLDADATFDGGDTDNLIDTDSYRDTLSAAKEVVNELKELPYLYQIIAPLPTSFSIVFYDLCDNFDLGPGFSIVRGSDLAIDFPLKTDVPVTNIRIGNSIGNELLKAPDPGGLYFVQVRSGYIGVQKDSPVIADFKTYLRQLLGAMLALNAFVPAQWRKEPFDGAMFAHRKGTALQISSAEKLTPQLRDFYSEMGHPKDGKVIPMTAKNKDSSVKKLNAIRSVFKMNEQGRRLSVAAIWYLRSFMSKDSLDALLESTIALEALLGGGNSEGTKLSNLLGNRCAYLVGRSLSERDEILSKFNEIYTLRSKIVHEGHHRFSKVERGLLAYSRELCRRALVKEMSMAVSVE